MGKWKTIQSPSFGYVRVGRALHRDGRNTCVNADVGIVPTKAEIGPVNRSGIFNEKPFQERDKPGYGRGLETQAMRALNVIAVD